jgi:hypothetical protein
MKIEFTEWMPDLPPLDNPGCVEAKNVIPRLNSFAELRALQPFSGALNSACLGAAWLPDLAGNAQNFSGTADRLYKYDSTNATWSNVSRTATYAAATQWSFEKFGDLAIATNIADNIQSFTMATSSKFQDLAGSPPRARYVAAVRDFLVLGNVSGYPNRVQWSGFNNANLWTPSLATQADYQDLPGIGGDVQGVVPGEYGVVFQESSIWRMDYRGPPVIFNFDEVERGRGTPSPRSIVHFGPYVYFYDWSGWYRFNGQQAEPIGTEKVNGWFERNCGSVSSIQGALDRNSRLIFWGFKSSGASAYNDRVIIYNYALDKWSWGEITTEWIGERRAAALTLDQLDVPLPDGIDIDSIEMDGKAFSSELSLQAFDTSHRACTFEGVALPATIETRELAFDESRADTNAVMPLIDGGTVVVQFGQRNTQAVTATYSNQIGLNRIGEACKVVTGRFQRFRLTITGGFDFARGIDIRTRKAGRR